MEKRTGNIVFIAINAKSSSLYRSLRGKLTQKMMRYMKVNGIQEASLIKYEQTLSNGTGRFFYIAMYKL